MQGKTSKGKVAINSIYDQLRHLALSNTIESIPLHEISMFDTVSDYLKDILVYFKAIIPNIKSKEKLYLILLEIETINKRIVKLPPNLNSVLATNHLDKPLSVKINYQIIKTYMTCNYQMLKIEHDLFDRFFPNYDHESDIYKKLSYRDFKIIGNLIEKDPWLSQDFKNLTSR